MARRCCSMWERAHSHTLSVLCCLLGTLTQEISGRNFLLNPPEVLLPDPQIGEYFSRGMLRQEFLLSFRSLKPPSRKFLHFLLSTWPNVSRQWAWLLLSQGRGESWGGKVSYNLMTLSHLIRDCQLHPLYFTLFSSASPAPTLRDVIEKRRVRSEVWKHLPVTDSTPQALTL